MTVIFEGQTECTLPVKNTFIHFEEKGAGTRTRALRLHKSEPPEPLFFPEVPSFKATLPDLSPSSGKETKLTLDFDVASTPSCPSPCSEGAATPCSPVEMRPPIFCFTLRRADEVPLGMNVALNRRQEVVVESISPWTALDSWNKFQVQGPQDRSVYPGDRIVSVNGFMAPALMLQECQTKLLLKMEVMRAGGLLELQPLPLSELV